MQTVWASAPWYVQLALKLLHERAQGRASQYADYLAILPSAKDIDLPVLWAEADVQELHYPHLQTQVRRYPEPH